jgi:CheY-like chemotaxis protein
VELGRHTVMIADDDPVALATATEALASAGFKVVQATDGQMPQVGGVEACHCLKAMPKTSKIPVVLTAAKKDPAARMLAERTHGSVRVLRKPFDPDDLVSVAKQLVRPKSLI